MYRIFVIYVKKLSSYNAFKERHQVTRKTKTANITKNDITLQHIAKMSLQSNIFRDFCLMSFLKGVVTAKFLTLITNSLYTREKDLSSKNVFNCLLNAVTEDSLLQWHSDRPMCLL